MPVKNIILYEHSGAVAGCCELRPGKGKTHIKLKQNLNVKDLFLSVVADGGTNIIKINGERTECEMDREINGEREIFVCIVQLKAEKPQTVASGVINLNKLKGKKDIAKNAVKEIDNALKSACEKAGCGGSECNKCPYREYFFGTAETG